MKRVHDYIIVEYVYIYKYLNYGHNTKSIILIYIYIYICVCVCVCVVHLTNKEDLGKKETFLLLHLFQRNLSIWILL